MRLNVLKATGILLVAGLLMPAGMLLASETAAIPTVTSSTANWFDVEQATNLLGQMQARALGVRKEVARLQVEGYELGWQVDAARLSRAKYDINTIGTDLMSLDQMKNKLEPWQQSLVHKITPEVHEMVYQTDAAIHEVTAHQNRAYLSLTQYPQYINQIYKNSNQMAGTIGTVTQYARAEQKMAELYNLSRTKRSS